MPNLQRAVFKKKKKVRIKPSITESKVYFLNFSFPYKMMWDRRSPWLPAYEQLDVQPLPQTIKWILIFPGALIKDLSINDPIPH